MVEFGGLLSDLIYAILVPPLAEKTIEYCLNKGINELNKKFTPGTTTLIFSNDELNDIMKIIKSLETSQCVKCV